MTTLPTAADRRGVTWLDLLAVAVVTFAVFTPVLHTPFSPLDDQAMLVGNTDITRPTWAAFKSFWTGPSFRIYMPLALSIWQTVARLTQSAGPGGDLLLTPFAFKAVSVATHALASAAAAWTLSVLTRTRWAAVAGALVFAMHPLQVEAVAWTTGLKDELCGLFSILCVGLYARHAARNPPSPWQDGWWWAAFGAAVMAMLGKPTAMVLPAVLLAVDWAVRRVDPVRRIVSVTPLLLPAIACALVIGTVQGNSPVQNLPPAYRPLVAGDAYAFYLGKTVWPAHTVIDYGRRPAVVRESGALAWTWVVPLAALAGVLALRSRPAVLAAVLFVVPIAPVSGLATFDMQQYSTVADHYAYQSLLGVGLLAAVLIERRPSVLGPACLVAVVLLAAGTRQAARKWQDLESFYRQTLTINPESFLVRNLLTTFALGKGDLFTARRLAEQNLAMNPDNGNALDNLSAVELLSGHYRTSADLAVRATYRLPIPSLALGRRLTLLGHQLNDINAAETGLRYWRGIEPDNRFVIDMLRAVQAEKAHRAATVPTTKPD